MGYYGQVAVDSTRRRMRFACWIIKATGTQPGFVILITYLRPQWLCKRASLLRYCTPPLLFESLSYVHPVFNLETRIIVRLLRYKSTSLYRVRQ